MGVHSNYSNSLYNDYEVLKKENDKLILENKFLKDNERRAFRAEKYAKDRLQEKKNIIKELKAENARLQKELDKLRFHENIDGTNSGIPTSMTPIGKKKIIPNSRKNTGEKIGRKEGHKKDKLERIPDEKIDEHIEHKLEECPNCKGHSLKETGKIISKDVKDYYIITVNKRHDYIEYLCPDCGKLVHEEIPNHLKEECQYGEQVKSLALTLTNIGNVPFNKTKRILSGLSMEEISPCEGYLAKLQKTASNSLSSFIKELHQAATSSLLLHWDDTVVMINTKRGCIRYYGNDSFSLFRVHEKKNKDGLDDDKILGFLGPNVVVEHDHCKVNYNPEYGFINAECCQHLLRDLEKVSINIPSRTWSEEGKKLFQEYDHKRNELMKENKDNFTLEEINDFILRLDQILLKGLDENESDTIKPYYSEKELTLIWRIMEYRDNYIYWILDFDIPFTNNLSERNLRGIKTKMKVSGQFQNITNAEYYANIRSYLETCRLYDKNEYDCLSRLVNGNPYTFAELRALKNK